MRDDGEPVSNSCVGSCFWRITCPLPQAVLTSVIALVTLSALSGSVAAGQSHTQRHRAKKGSICGNPTVACKTSVPFEPNDLPFRVPANSVIFDTELFYAIILKSVGTSEDDCTVFVPENERLQTQALFPEHKVFTSKCADPGGENPGLLFYTNVNPKVKIMAVYGGTTLAEAKRVLEAVKATGNFPGANLRLMRTGFNGT